MPTSGLLTRKRHLAEPIGTAAIISLLVVTGVVTLQNLGRMRQDVNEVRHSYEVLNSMDAVASALKDAESGQRGYLLTGDPSYLEPYESTEAMLDGLLETLQKRTAENPVQNAVREELAVSVAVKRQELRQTIELMRNGDKPTAQTVVQTDDGKTAMDTIREKLAMMRANAEAGIADQKLNSYLTYRTAYFTTLLTTIAGLALVGGVIWSISHQRKLKERNRELDEQIRLFLEQISDYAIFMMDPQCRATTWNSGVRQVLGFEEHTFLGRDVRPLIFTPQAHESGFVEAEFENASKNGSASDDRWMQRKDGTQFWASGITTAIRNRQNELVGFSKVMRDMTEQKQNSDELSRLASELAEESRRKNEFLATLAHELRNPLSPIKNAIQLMSMMDVSDDVEELRATMARQVEQIVRLLDDLMDVSRIGRGKIELKKQVVQVSTILQAAVEASRSLIESNHQHLTVTVADTGLSVDVDPARITQVVSNLLNNASKYSDVECTIKLSAEQVDDHVAVRVADNGSGISPDRIEDIFEMFAQVEDSVERGTAGLGIGLTLVRTLVELHGGTVAAHSDGVGQGSEFTINLKLAATKELSESTPSALLPSTADVPAMRVMVVDDMRALSTVLSRLLAKLGHEVQVADSGPAALQVLETFQAQVIFSDISMPGMTGYELAKRLRKNDATKHIHLVAMTGYGQQSDRDKALKAGFDEHMVKPVDFKVLQGFFASFHDKP